MAKLTPDLRRLALQLGALNFVGGLAVDIYLPVLPRMARDLAVPIGRAQLTLTTFIFALALGQIVYGPLSDRFGRRRPLAAGLVLYAAASFLCANAHSLDALIAWRFVQGLGAAATLVISQAIARDRSSGPSGVHLLGLILGVGGIAPVVSPLIGGLAAYGGAWRALFFGLGLAALAAMSVLAAPQPRRRPDHEQTQTLHAFLILLRDRRFLALAVLPGLTQASTFAFVSSAPFLFMTTLGMRPYAFSILFGVTSLALVGGAHAAGRVAERLGPARTVCGAVAIHLGAACALLAATLSQHVGMALACGVFFLVFGCIGPIGAPATVLALAPYPRFAGTAAALCGALQMALGALGSQLASIYANGTALPLALTMTAFTALAMGVSLALFAPTKTRN